MQTFSLGVIFSFLIFLILSNLNYDMEKDLLCEELYPLKKHFDYCFAESSYIDLQYKFSEEFISEINKKITLDKE